MVKAEKGVLLHSLGRAMGRGRVALSSSSAIFGVQILATGLSRQKNWRQGTKVCIVKTVPVYRCGPDWQNSLGQAGGLVSS
jgi:hypothetical protein